MTTPGGWQGIDPLLRALRSLAIIAFLGMLAIVVADPDRTGNTELLFLLFGSILVALGYPVVMKLPSIFTPKPKDPPDDVQ